MSQNLIPRTRIVDLVAKRNKVVAIYGEFFDRVDDAFTLLQEASRLLDSMLIESGQFVPYSKNGSEELKEFKQATKPIDTAYLRDVLSRIVDTRMWEHVVRTTELETLMDNTAKEELRRQLEYQPIRPDRQSHALARQHDENGMPPFTEENIEATLAKFASEAGTIWRRGLAEAFSSLDSRFKTHDGFTVGRIGGKGATGGRIILEHAFNDHGSWAYNEKQKNRLLDVERAFLLLDGKKINAAYAGIIGQINAERVEHRPHESCHENEYFRVRIYANGNLHVWLKRRDLVQKVNEELANYYSTDIGWGRYEDGEEPADPNRHASRALDRPLARNFGEFDSPKEVADRVVKRLLESRIKPAEEGGKLRVLEPSAGIGNLVSRLAETCDVDVVEIQRERCRYLRESGKYQKVISSDFLQLDASWKDAWKYDLIAMNPPFDQLRDIDHVTHAFDFLRPGGRLVSVMSASARYSSRKKAKTFVRWVEAMRGRFEDLPAGSFRSAGTNVNSCIVVIDKPKTHKPNK